MNKDILAGFIAKDFNTCVDKGVFPDDIKHALHQFIKRNYMPVSIVSILTNISKMYEKLIYNQHYDYFNDILSRTVQYAVLPTSHARKI